MQQLNKVSTLEVTALMRCSAHVNMWVCPMANSSCFSAALFQRLKINIRFVLYFPCCASSLYEVMPHTGNASIIFLVAQSSFLQTGWHNILSMVNASGFFLTTLRKI